jgi:hypothetical protein
MSQAPRSGPALLGSRLADDVPMRYLIQRPGPADPNACVQCRYLKAKVDEWLAANGSAWDGLGLLRLSRAHRLIAHRGQRRQRVPT